MNNEIEVITLCRKIFGVPTLVAATMFSDMPEWDSLSYAELLIAVETEFNIQMDNEEMRTIDSVESLILLINRRKY
jgi:acyl carrier protein